MDEALRKWIRESILTYGFRSTVEMLCRKGMLESAAIKIVREVHDAIPGAKIAPQ